MMESFSWTTCPILLATVCTFERYFITRRDQISTMNLFLTASVYKVIEDTEKEHEYSALNTVVLLPNGTVSVSGIC